MPLWYAVLGCTQWCIAKNGGGYTQRGAAKGLKVPSLVIALLYSLCIHKIGLRISWTFQLEGTLLIYDHRGEYTLSKKPRKLLYGVYLPIHHWLHTFTAVPRSTQPCILPGLLIEYELRWGKGRNVTSAVWHVTLCDPIWHVSSRSSVAMLHCKLLYPHTLLYLTKSNKTPERHTLARVHIVESGLAYGQSLGLGLILWLRPPVLIDCRPCYCSLWLELTKTNCHFYDNYAATVST